MNEMPTLPSNMDAHMNWLGAILAVLLTLYVYGTWTYDSFKKRNMIYLKPTLPFLGAFGPVVMWKTPLSIFTSKLYNQCKGYRYTGFFEFRSPVLLIRDPEVIKLITVKHFNEFHDRRALFSQRMDPAFRRNLFILQGKEWHDMRVYLTPIFTSNKLSVMSELLWTCGKQICDYLENQHIQQKGGNPDEMLIVNMKDLFMRYATDVVVTIAYGESINSLKYPNNKYYLVGQEIIKFRFMQLVRIAGYLLFPNLMELLGVRITTDKTVGFLHNSLIATMAKRKESNEVRCDLVQFLLSIKQKQLQNEKTTYDDFTLSSQSILFFQAGMEGVSTALYFLSNELAWNPHIQERLQEEIDSVIKEHGDRPTTDIIRDMKYLNMVVSELLRMYPTLPTTDRVCTEDCTIPETILGPSFTIKKGDALQISIYGLHHDPEHFPEPETFDPERFSDENKHMIKPCTYIPFGIGPRHCIGQRFVLIQIKVVAFIILSRFSFVPEVSVRAPKSYSKGTFFISPASGSCLGIKPRFATN